MKTQLVLIFALVFALITGIFAVINVEPVAVNYLFGTAHIPLILVILGSTLLGALIVGLLGIIRQYRLQRKIRQLEKELEELREKPETKTATHGDPNEVNTEARLQNESGQAAERQSNLAGEQAAE